MQGVVGSSPIFSTQTANVAVNQPIINRTDKTDETDSNALGSAITVGIMGTYSPPRLYDAGGDLSKEWYVEFYFSAPGAKPRRKKLIRGFKEIATVEERMAFGIAEVKRYTELLRSGWNPFPSKIVQNENHLQYKSHLHEANYNISKFLNDYLAEVKLTHRLRDKSLSTYFTKLMKFDKWLKMQNIAHLMPGEFTLAHAQAFLTDVRAGKLSKKKMPVANKTYNSYRGTLLSVWNWIADKNEENAPRNPWRKCAKLKVDFKRKYPYTDEQKEKIFNFLEQKGERRMLLIVKLIYRVFIRPGREMRMLQVQDIDFYDNLIWIESDISKNKKTRKLPLLPELRTLFEEMQLHTYAGGLYIFGKHGISDKPAPVNYWGTKYSSLMRELGVTRNQTLYTWKDTGNKEYHEKGMPPHMQKLLNGHYSLDQMNAYLDNFRPIGVTDVTKYL